MNVSSVMTDVKHSITKNVHKLRVNLDKEQSEVCPNTHKDVPDMGGKNPERFYCRFYIKFNWAEGASGHRSVCFLAAGRISDTLIISCALTIHPHLSKLKFCVISVVLK